MSTGHDDILILLAGDIDRYYEHLVNRYWHQVRAFVLRRVRNVQDAEDIVQDVFIRAYYALQRYSVPQIQTLKVRPWLYTIAWNLFCNFTRRSNTSWQIPFADSTEDGTIPELLDERGELPEEYVERLEQRQELETLLETLPYHYSVVVSLYYFDELGYQEIAELLNQPPGTVKVYVHRGLRLLRKKLTTQANAAR